MDAMKLLGTDDLRHDTTTVQDKLLEWMDRCLLDKVEDILAGLF